jgi:enoyl-CoA hydratase
VSTRLLLSQEKEILLVTLESEDEFPRLEQQVLAAIEQAIAHLQASKELSGAVITGTARAFASGAEIAELSGLTPVEAHGFAWRGQRLLEQIDKSHKPVIAAIRGYCKVGGLDLALACRHRIATPCAVFAHPGGAIGLLTGWGGTQRLPRLIGRGRALKMLTTGSRVEANEALQWGLVRQIVAADKLIPEAILAHALRPLANELRPRVGDPEAESLDIALGSAAG